MSRLWPLGYSYVGDVTFDSAAYVARYSLKKVVGERDDLDRLVMKDSGEILSAEYVTMSRRPGIGASWYGKFSSDVYPHGNRIVRGFKSRPPRYYDKLFELDNPIAFEDLKFSRQNSLDKSDNTMLRLAVKEEVTTRRLKLYPRE